MNWVVMAGLCWALAVHLAWPPPAAGGLLRVATWADGAKPGVPGLDRRRRAVIALLLAVGLPALSPSGWALLAAPILAVVAYVLAGRLESGEVTRTRRRLGEQLPEALGLMASALAAGAPLRTAVGDVADLTPPATSELLSAVLGHIQVGRSEAEAWAWVAADPVVAPIWGRAAKDLARSVHSGAAVVDILRRHATDARLARAADIEKQARTVGVKSVLPLMVCFLPAFLLVGVVPIIAGLVGTFVP